MRRGLLASTLALLVACACARPAGPPAAPAPRLEGPSLDDLRAVGAALVHDVYRYTPATAGRLRVLVALHGMGGNGPEFAAALLAEADRHHWLVLAPTIEYGDWTDPAEITREDPALVAWLSTYLATLSDRVGRPTEPRVLLFGHSRGAQLALRFAEIHPEQVSALAAEAAGTYTLPLASLPSSGTELDFPFGIADLASVDGGRAFSRSRFASVPIWIGVGARDADLADVPHVWDPFIGPTRVDRATTFTRTLRTLGVAVDLTVFPDTDHTLTSEAIAAASASLVRMSEVR